MSKMAAGFESNFSISSILSNNSVRLQAGDQTVRMSIDSSNTSCDGPPPSPASCRNSPKMSPDQKSSAIEMPTYTYRTLILMAIRNSPERRLPLSGICDWIAKEFPFYRENKSRWQNSIRHSLSLNSMFIRIPRALDDPGQGNYWAIDPAYDDITISENTGHLRRSKSSMNSSLMIGPIRSKSAHLLHHGASHPYCISHHAVPKALYFPTPKKQLQAAQSQAHQHDLIALHRMNKSMQSWKNFNDLHHLPLLQQSLIEARYIQKMFPSHVPMDCECV